MTLFRNVVCVDVHNICDDNFDPVRIRFHG